MARVHSHHIGTCCYQGLRIEACWTGSAGDRSLPGDLMTTKLYYMVFLVDLLGQTRGSWWWTLRLSWLSRGTRPKCV
jgi:hypothetical protein